MVKKLLAVSSLFLVLTASADILYWTVDTTALANGIGDAATGYSYARIYQITTATDAGTPTVTIPSTYTALENTVSGYGSTVSDITKSVATAATVAANFDLTESTTSYFYMEIFNTDNDVIAISSIIAYANLAEQGFTSTKSMVVNHSAWGGTAFAAPEPTSGLLMLIGAALLGLKRRKVA